MQTATRWVPPQPDDANQRRAVEHYDAKAAGYDAQRSPFLTRRDSRILLELLSPRPGEHALDAGCGTGVQARQLAALGLRVCAVDLGPRMLELVAPFVHEAHLADIADLDLGPRFDCIVCNGVLDFVPSPDRCIEVLAHHLRPGGRLAVIAPRRSLLGAFYSWRHRVQHGIHVHLFHRHSFQDTALRCGLRELGVLHPFLHTIAFGWIREAR
jgi:2-polyprenyl-3-methyl-5-hydroxy-6-metoxy-1,4-benzoquinol methylase